MTDRRFQRQLREWFDRIEAAQRSEWPDLLERAECDAAGLRAELEALLPVDALPDAIGGYRVLGLLGRGGFSSVYRAAQEHPVRREVAIKVLDRGSDPAALRRLLSVERAALEQLDHPGVAKILDVGETEAGQPFLVIEYVEGDSLVEHCRRRGIDLRQRIALMLEVAEVVRHAHSAEVIHRDLKPTNIMVRAVDGSPVVLDFGIAKHLTKPSTGMTGQLLLGTLGYMAPEQVLGQPARTAVDVYGLGATLFELAAGRPPVAGRSDLDVAHSVLHEPAPRLARSAATPWLASAPAALRRDLDIVLQTALAKEPERRYETVAAFAADLRQLLAAAPVAAHPPSWQYQLRCFARRHRAVVLAAAAVVIAVVGGVSALVYGLGQARAERRDQQAINAFLFEDVLAPVSMDRLGPRVTGLDLMRQAGARIDQRFSASPHLARRLHLTFAELMTEMQAFTAADEHLDGAARLPAVDAADRLRLPVARAGLMLQREQNQQALARLPGLVEECVQALGELHSLSRRALLAHAQARLAVDEFAAAEELAGRALALHGRVGDAPIAEVRAAGVLAWATGGRGDTAAEIGLLEEALARVDALATPARGLLTEISHNLGVTHLAAGEVDRAVPHLQRAAEVAAEILPAQHGSRIAIEDALAGVLFARRDYAEAAALRRRLVVERTALLGATAEPTLRTRLNLGLSLQAAGEAAAAIDCLEEALAAARGVEAPPVLVARLENGLAHALVDQDRDAEIVGLLVSAVPVLRRYLDATHPTVVAAVRLAARYPETGIGGP